MRGPGGLPNLDPLLSLLALKAPSCALEILRAKTIVGVGMPSWKVHKALYEKLSREVEGFVVWTLGLLERIDKIIDKEYGEHDLGRKAGLKGMESFYRMLRALWLEFGDIYDTLTESFLHADYLKKLDIAREMLRNPKLAQRYMMYVPDDALALATLHHVLDVATDCLLNTHPPITIDRSASLFEQVRESMKGYVHGLKELKTMRGSTYEQVFDWLINVLKERGQQVYTILAEYLKSKGLEPGYGPEVLIRLLQDLVREKGYYGIVYVNNTPLPVAAAAVKAFNELTKGKRVVLGFSRYGGPYPPVHEVVEASSVRELCEKLRAELQK